MERFDGGKGIRDSLFTYPLFSLEHAYENGSSIFGKKKKTMSAHKLLLEKDD